MTQQTNTAAYSQHHRHILEWKHGKYTGVFFLVGITCTTVMQWDEAKK